MGLLAEKSSTGGIKFPFLNHQNEITESSDPMKANMKYP
jgi:hypothetical protein